MAAKKTRVRKIIGKAPVKKVRVRRAVKTPLGGETDAPRACGCCDALTPRVVQLEQMLAALATAPAGSAIFVDDGVIAVLAPPAVGSTLGYNPSTGPYWLPD